MAEEHDVRIVGWPDEQARLRHSFDLDNPASVYVRFDEPPANVVITTPPGGRLDVNMAMKVAVRDTVPVCLKLCEPLCAKSDYSIGITIFDRPVATISIRGLTRLFNCQDEEL